MTKRGIAGLRAVTALVLVAALAAGCSSSDEAASPDSTSPERSTTTSTVGPKITAPRQSCAADTLGAAAVAAFEAPALVDLVCETEFATATLTNGPGGENVVFFTLQNGVWVLAGSGAPADAATATPAGFSATAVPAWQRLRDARLTRGDRTSPALTPASTVVPPSSLVTNPATGEEEICTEWNVDVTSCTPNTTSPPGDPEDPGVAPPPDAPESMFCKYNYNDPRCVADPSFKP